MALGARWSKSLALGLALAAAVAPAQGRVAPSGQLRVARVHHTTTLLGDGRVLVVGGRSLDGTTALASVELFDPRTRRWSQAAPLSVGRSTHAATLLDDGRVLVTGGLTEVSSGASARFVALASAELYEPRKNAWTLTRPMAEARGGHTATLLIDGTVLVVGGAREERVNVGVVERFDPKTAAFQSHASLPTPRAGHLAIRLADGSVVVLGGHGARGASSGASVVLDAVERFLPASQAWQVAPRLSEPRQRSAAVVQADEVLVIGGQTATGSTNLVEAWAPGSPAWAPRPSLSMGLVGHSATRLSSGDVVVIGGESPTSVDTASVQRWRHDTQRWCQGGQLQVARKGHTATLLAGGRVLVVGGTSGGLPEASVELWEGTSGRCEEPPSLPLE